MIKKEKAIKEEKKKPDDDWMTRKWRPMMAIMYMFCCLADFFIFPIMFTVVQFWETAIQNDAFRQWVPITLQGGGLFHVAMGAVLGVSAYGRTQEKLNGAAGGAPGATNAQPGFAAPSMGGSTFGTPSPNLNQPGSSYNSPGTNSWGTTPIMGNTGGYQPGYGATPPQGNSFGATGQVTAGFGGKLAPPQPDFYPER
jgi:hypothetical protein